MKHFLNQPGLLKKNIVILFFGGCFVFFAFFYQYHLYFIEQLQLFRFSNDYIKSYFQKPASLACLLGDFLTQFYYLKAGGSLIITFTLLLFWYLLHWFFSHVFSWKYAYLAALLITALVTGFHMSIVYPLSATIALIIALLAFRLYTLLTGIRIRLITGLALIPVIYLAAGWGVYLFLATVICFEFRNNQGKSLVNWGYILILLSIIIFFPASIRSQYLLTGRQARLYPVPELTKPAPNFLFELMFSLDYEWHSGHPEKTIKLARKSDMNNPFITYYYNLASAAMNKLPDNLLSFYQDGLSGMFIPFNEETNFISLIFGNEVHYFIGDINASQYYALMANTFSPRCESSRMIRRLVETNIINGEYEAAEKYVKMLKKTLFHRRWARNREPYLFNEELCRKTPWIAGKRAQMPVTDKIKPNPNDFVGTLYHQLNDHPDNQAALEYLLNLCLLYKDIDSFYQVLTNYQYHQTGLFLHRIYQEALIVYNDMNQGKMAGKNFAISDEVIRKFMKFKESFNQSNGYKNALVRSFGDTYWFYLSYAVVPQ